MDIHLAVAQNIRQVREQKKLTLDAASSATGVSRSMLAQIERGDVNPTILVLWKIANGYKVSFTSLIEPLPELTSVILAQDIRPMVEDEGRYLNYPAFHLDDQRLFETYRIVIAPQGTLQAAPHLAGTEEYITVFSGTVHITVQEELFCLHTGDSLKFQADVPHSYQNPGEQEVHLSMLIYYGKSS